MALRLCPISVHGRRFNRGTVLRGTRSAAPLAKTEGLPPVSPVPLACSLSLFLSSSLFLCSSTISALVLPRLAALNHDDDLSHEIIISVQITDTRKEVAEKEGKGGRPVMENPGRDCISAETYFLLLDVLCRSLCRSLHGETVPLPPTPRQQWPYPVLHEASSSSSRGCSGASGFTRSGCGKEKEKEITEGKGKGGKRGGPECVVKYGGARPNRDDGRGGGGESGRPGAPWCSSKRATHNLPPNTPNSSRLAFPFPLSPLPFSTKAPSTFRANVG